MPTNALHVCTLATSSIAQPPGEWKQWLPVMWLPIAAAVMLLVLWLADVIRPGSFERAKGRWAGRGASAGGQHGWLEWLTVGGVLFCFAQLAAILTAQMPSSITGLANSMQEQTVRLIVAHAASIVLGFILLRVMRPGGSAKGSGTTPADLTIRPLDLPLGVVLLFGAFPIVQVLSGVSMWLAQRLHAPVEGPISHKGLQEIVSHRADPWAWGVTFVAIVTAPILEEIVFRACLQTGFIRLFGGRRWSAIFVTATLFACLHLGAVPWYALPPLWTLAVGLGIAYERTGSLAVPIAMHGAFNALNIAIALGSQG